MKNKNKIIASVLVVIIAVTSVVTSIVISNASESPKVKVVSSTIIENYLNQIMKETAGIAYSSNPYDYIKNEPYNNMVELGISALPTLYKMVLNSNEAGLKEYLIAVCAEEIVGVNLKGDNYAWGDSKEWANVWKDYVRNIDETVKNRVDKGMPIDDLGILALPEVIELIESGHTDLIDDANTLLKNKNLIIEENSIISDEIYDYCSDISQIICMTNEITDNAF